MRQLKDKENVEEYGELLARIGSGASGSVYKRGTVAVKKFIIKDRDWIFYTAAREISILLNLDHINIVSLLDIFVGQDDIQIVLEKQTRI